MANSLQRLFHALAKRLRSRIAQVRDERELRLAYIDGVAEHFGVQRWGIYLLDEYRVEIAAIASAQFFFLNVNLHNEYFFNKSTSFGGADTPIRRCYNQQNRIQ